MKIKTAFAEQFSTHDYDPDFVAHYFGRIEIHLDTQYMLLDDLHTQRVTLSILVLQDGTVDTDRCAQLRLTVVCRMTVCLTMSLSQLMS